MRRTYVALIITVLVLPLVACSIDKKSAVPTATSSQGGGIEHGEDVKITACAPDAAGYAAAEVTISNNSSKSSNYVVTVAMETSNGATQIGTGLAAVNALAPGQEAVESASTLKDAPSSYTCRVTDVTRYAA